MQSTSGQAKNRSIGDLSNETGVSIETIRYYEREKILPDPARTDSGHRLYGNEDVKRLNFIHKCRNLGFSLKQISSLLSLVDDGSFTCKQVHEITCLHADEVRGKIADLTRMERVLTDMAEQCGKGNVPDCPIIDELFET